MTQKISGAELRQSFIDYFKSKGHAPVPSSSLIPENDPTLLFANAGMNQFKDLFLGSQKREYTRAVSSQKCLRISGKHNDLENVGMTARHHTFFEMLGNFSFGDYFKADAIRFAWEFITKTIGLDRNKLWVTVYEKDDEAAKLWKELTDVIPDRILRLGEKDNFWAMGETGPCGPCSEIHYYMGDKPDQQSEAEFRAEDGSYLEIWNLVFMQYDRSIDGKLTPLPKPSVDTGMGLERIASVVQGVKSNYDTDLLRGIISECENLTGLKYDGSSFAIRDLKSDKQYARDVAMRVIADHSRAIAFLIADGAVPGSDGRGYVLRRLIRRAVRHGRVLNFQEPFLSKTTASVINSMGSHFPELVERRDIIQKIADAEERKFYETLDAGLAILTRECEKLKSGDLFSGELGFQLHDTYGFPLDLTADVLKAYNLTIDVPAFDRCMAAQKSRSREDRKSRAADFVSIKIDGPKTEFVGYDQLQVESVVNKITSPDGKAKDSFKEGDEICLVVSATPFYAESGGQVGDSGHITLDSAKIDISDTQKVQDGYYLHYGTVAQGSVTQKMQGSKAQLYVDADRRNLIRAHHSATHITHAALRNILGAHVKQAGSRVDDFTLRFDYSHFAALDEKQIAEIQAYINREIRANYEVNTRIMNVDEAKKTGAMALFGEKYGDKVRVVEIGPNSLELCGGTHVARSGDIGFLIIESDSGISAGVRRIECVAGAVAESVMLGTQREMKRIAELLKGDQVNLPDKIERLMQRLKQLEKEVEQAKSRLASAASGDLINTARTTPGGIKVIAEKVDSADSDTLKNMVDRLRVKIGSGVVALGAQQGTQAIIIVGATADLANKVNVGNVVREAVKTGGGRGGGRADFAQAGGVELAQLGATLEKVVELIS